MTRRHRYLGPIALALALAAAVPTAQAGSATPNPAAGAEAKGYAALSQAILNTSWLQRQAHAAGAEAILNTSQRQSQFEVATADGFNWGDAGIGAAATLGLMLFIGGLGLGLVVHGRSRQPTHA